jgi:serine/threonine protein kinase
MSKSRADSSSSLEFSQKKDNFKKNVILGSRSESELSASDSSTLSTSSAVSPADSPSVSQQFARITLDAFLIEAFPRAAFNPLNRLGKGQFATVYRYKTDVSDYAVKAIDLKLSKKEDCEREILMLALLKEQPGVVQLHGFYFLGEPATHCVVAMECMNSGTLEQWIAHPTTMLLTTFPQRVNAMRQLAEAVAGVHNHDIVICDIKSANILLHFTNELIIKLADFGFARKTAPNSSKADTDSLAGSPSYMAPEVLRRERNNSKEADVFSLCIVLWEILNKKHIGQFYKIWGILKLEQLQEWINHPKNRPPISKDPSLCPPSLAKQMTLGFLRDFSRRPEAINLAECLTESIEEKKSEAPPSVSLRKKFE